MKPFDGRGFQSVPIIAYGRVALAGNANEVRSAVVTFPADWFPGSPNVQATSRVGSTNASTINTEVSVTSESTTGFTLNVNRSNTTQVSVNWYAIYSPIVADLQLMSRVTPLDWAWATATCRTRLCSNADIPVAYDPTWIDEDGVEHPVDSVVCGVCSRPIRELINDSEPGPS